MDLSKYKNAFIGAYASKEEIEDRREKERIKNAVQEKIEEENIVYYNYTLWKTKKKEDDIIE